MEEDLEASVTEFSGGRGTGAITSHFLKLFFLLAFSFSHFLLPLLILGLFTPPLFLTSCYLFSFFCFFTPSLFMLLLVTPSCFCWLLRPIALTSSYLTSSYLFGCCHGSVVRCDSALISLGPHYLAEGGVQGESAESRTCVSGGSNNDSLKVVVIKE